MRYNRIFEEVELDLTSAQLKALKEKGTFFEKYTCYQQPVNRCKLSDRFSICSLFSVEKQA